MFSGKTSLSRLSRRVETLTDFLLRSNSVPCGSVLLTGTGIIVTEDARLQPGDVVKMAVPGIGTLQNPAILV